MASKPRTNLSKREQCCITRDMLLLIPIEVPLSHILKWTDVQRMKAEDYAGALHAKAADNAYVRVPKRPYFLAQYAEVRRG